MAAHRDVLIDAFAGPGWRETTESLFEATGLAVAVMDVSAESVIHFANHCSYCELATGVAGLGPATCFDERPPVSDRTVIQTACRAGLPCYVTPVVVNDEFHATVLVGGFVASTRDRKRLFEKLLGKGVSEPQARLAIREIPIMTKREVEALVRLVRTAAMSLMERTLSHRIDAGRTAELDAYARAAAFFADSRGMGEAVLAAVVERALPLADADSGVLFLLRRGTDLLELHVTCGECEALAADPIVRMGEGIVGRVASSGVAEVAPWPERGRARIAVPLFTAGRIVGVLLLDGSARRHAGSDDLQFLERYGRMAAAALERARGDRERDRRAYEHAELGGMASTLGVAADIDEVLELAASVMEKSFDFEVAGFVLTGWGRDHATVVLHGDASAAGIDAVLSEAAGRDILEFPLRTRRMVTHLGEVLDAEDAEDDGDWLVMTSELMVRDSVVGYAFLGGKGEGLFAAGDRRLLDGLAGYTALALERAGLVQRMRDDLARTIMALSATLDATGHSARDHSDRVMDYAMAIGEEMGLGVEDVELLRFAGLLHDVGRAGISEEILLRPSKSGDDDAGSRRRLQIGEGIVEQVEFLNAIAPVIMHHHERFDGGGYPMGLSGPDIPLLARILAVADSFDALTSERALKRRLSYAEVKSQLMEGVGTQFDPEVVDAFLEAMDRRALAGTTGLLVDRPNQGPQLPA